MAERRGGDLSERRTLRAARVKNARGNFDGALARGKVAELVNNRTLLCHDEQQQQA